MIDKIENKYSGARMQLLCRINPMARVMAFCTGKVCVSISVDKVIEAFRLDRENENADTKINS